MTTTTTNPLPSPFHSPPQPPSPPPPNHHQKTKLPYSHTNPLGIGHALVSHLLLRPHTTVIGTSRTPFPTPFPPSSPTSSFLPLLLDDANPQIASDTLAARLASEHNITKLDVVVANAGASSGFRDVLDLEDVEGELTYDFVANAVGPVRLFRGVWGLLKEGGGGRFVLVSSVMGSIGGLGEEMLPGLAWYVCTPSPFLSCFPEDAGGHARDLNGGGKAGFLLRGEQFC